MTISGEPNKIVSANQWVKILEGAIESRKGSQNLSHQYVSHDGHAYTLVDQSSIEKQKQSDAPKSTQKLPLSQIVKISQEKFKDIKNAYEKGDMDESRFMQLSNKLSKYTEGLVAGRETKRDQTKWQIARGVARVFAVITSIVCGAGVYLWNKLNADDTKFKKETADLKNSLLTIKNDPRKMELEAKLEAKLAAKQEIQEKINSSINIVPTFLKSFADKFKDENRLETLINQVKKDFDGAKLAPDEPVHQFEKDIKRGMTIVIKDPGAVQQNNLDPFEKAMQDRKMISHLPPEERAKAGADILKQVIKHEEDRDWGLALQAVANQTSINCVFDTVIMTFNSFYNQKWTDPDTNRDQVLICKFSSTNPPVELNIKRDEKTGLIKEVKVEISSSLDILSCRSDDAFNALLDKKILSAEAITGKLMFTLSLDENKSPIISDLKSDLKTKIKEGKTSFNTKEFEKMADLF